MQTQRLEALKNLFDKYEIDAYLLPTTDEFLNEYTPSCLNRLQWLTGFESSNAIALITQDQNYLFTDQRYIEAAEKKLGSTFLIKDLYRESVWDFIRNQNLKVGIAPELFIKNEKMHHIKFIDELVDLIWQRNKVNDHAEYFYYDEQYSGTSFKQRAEKVCAKMAELSADFLVITQPDLICWLTNLRGRDQDFTPLVLAYAILDRFGRLELFLYNNHAKKPLIEGIRYCDFAEFRGRLSSLTKVIVDPLTTNLSVLTAIDLNNHAIFAPNPIIELRAIKNEIEIANAKKVHLIDSLAMINFLSSDFEGMSEQDVKDLSYKCRDKSELFFSPSFETIAGFKENSSVIHYHIRPETNKKIHGDGLLLIDSGGQYLGGTTDITRTVLIGKATKEQIFAYTIVLRAHLHLSNAKFKCGTTGSELDKMIRSILQVHGMDYGHGTGHGVGNFLSVHETPPRISSQSHIELKAGMIISNEPGFYKKGEFGIRIENLCLVVQIDNETLGMEDLTLVPYEEKLIDYLLLTTEEKTFLDNYNQKIAQGILKIKP